MSQFGGNRVGSARENYALVSATGNNQRALSDGFARRNIWVFRMGGWIGRSGANPPQVYFAGWLGTAAGVPGIRLGYTEMVAPNTAYNNATGGAQFQSPVVATRRAYSPSNAAILVRDGQEFFYGFANRENQLGVATLATLAEQSVASPGGAVPRDPFDRDGVLTDGVPAIWYEYDLNTPPAVPSAPSPADASFVNTTLPTLGATFSDANEDRGDGLKQVQFRLKVTGAAGWIWNETLPAAAAEQAAKRVDRAVPTELVAGTTYSWDVRFQDRADEWGEFTATRTFTVNTGGFVALDDVPTGKVLDTTGITYKGRWSHPAALNANRVQVRLLQGGREVRTSPEVVQSVASSAAPGTLFSIQPTEHGFPALAAGVAYEYQIRARDTATPALWSPWSDPRSFNTDAPPRVPTNLQPPSGATSPDRPLLAFDAVDPDDEPEPVGVLRGQIRLKNAAGTVLAGWPQDVAWNAVALRWERQIGTADTTAGQGTYRWDARTISNGKTSAWSVEQSFVFALGIQVVVTSPNQQEVVGTTTPIVRWQAVADQTSYRVRVFAVGAVNPFYDSRTVVAAATEHAIPVGQLRNATSYDLTVELANGSGLSGESQRRRFRVSFVPGDVIAGVSASAVRLRGDRAAVTVDVNWERSRASPGSFAWYVVRRSVVGDAGSTVVLARISNIEQTGWRDLFPASGVPYRYRVSQVARQGNGDEVESDEVYAEASVVVPNLVLTSTTRGAVDRISLNWRQSRRLSKKRDVRMEHVWGGGLPLALISPNQTQTLDVEYVVLEEGGVSARDQVEAFARMVDAAEVVCARDEGGLKAFGVIKDAEWEGPTGDSRKYEVGFSFESVSYREGVTT